MPAYEHLTVERPAGGVALLTLDNPDLRNAMSDEMTASWVAAVAELAADRSLRAVVVTGAGSAFCSGGNTGWIASEPDATVGALRSRVVDADEALRIGLVSRVLDTATFLDDVLEIASGIASTAPIATRLTKLALLDGGHRDLETALQWEAMAQPITLATEDLQEGI